MQDPLPLMISWCRKTCKLSWWIEW